MRGTKMSVLKAALPAVVCACAGVASAVPDVIVGDLLAPSRYTPAYNGYWAFAIGTTSCNVGDTTLSWVASTNQHPVIGQTAYRYKTVNGTGRFEMIGISWLKHGFTALNETLCGPCSNPDNTGSTLDPTCSDPYVASLNGSQSGLGPRFQVNAYTGFYPYPVTGVPAIPPTGDPQRGVFRRLNIHQDDLAPALNPGALYFGEGHYVTPDDAAAGNGNNNASYRRMYVTALSPSGYNLSFQSSGSGNATVRRVSGIFAWRGVDPLVQIANVDVPGEGRFEVAYRAQLGTDGLYHYEYMVRNHNSDRSAGSVTLRHNGGASGCMTISGNGFRDVYYHSGEPYDQTDWGFALAGTDQKDISWSTTPHSTNPNANALRWSTAYTFRVSSPNPPEMGTMAIGLFKPGTPGEITTPVLVPSIISTDIDFNNDGVYPDSQDITDLLNVFGGGECAACDSIDINRDGVFPDTTDIQYFLSVFSGNPCP